MSEQHAVVVGGTRGLGRLVVENFLARGFSVSVVSRHKPAGFAESAACAISRPTSKGHGL